MIGGAGAHGCTSVTHRAVKLRPRCMHLREDQKDEEDADDDDDDEDHDEDDDGKSMMIMMMTMMMIFAP